MSEDERQISEKWDFSITFTDGVLHLTIGDYIVAAIIGGLTVALVLALIF